MTLRAGWARASRRARVLQQRWFPPRQIVVREADRAIALSLRPGFQMTVAAALAVGIVWSAGATVGYLVNWGGAALARAETDRLRAGYGQLIDEVSRQHSKVLDITQDLEHDRSYLLALLDQVTHPWRATPSSGHSAATQAQGADGDAQRTAAAEQAVRGQLDDLARDLVGVNRRNQTLETDLSELRQAVDGENDPERFEAARDILERRMTRLEQDANGAATRTRELERTLTDKQQLVDEAQTARRQAIRERDEMGAKLADAEKHIKSMAQAHDQTLAQLSEETRSAITEVERIVNAAGLDTRRLVPVHTDVRRQNRGGPFVPWSAYQGTEPGPRSDATPQTLHSEVARLEDLRALLRVLPLAAPIKQEFAVTSTFGYRLDPFNNLAAFHTGVDLQAPLRTPVVAPAAGKVVFAGWHAAYGRMVEIDHGYGIRTRYAHLDRIAVHEGEDIAAGAQIGLLGATGRTSAQHLHYEVLVDGRPRNPLSFMKAAADVRKNR
ncbi:MAG TPA: peptidoglycan DD-metalloendopeptidase family protein [Candidatus Sulfotelmatobacter sp.]|nr:peptidoglycan DD-metalloendopeptidase family protein [Candidatus Sulfotelmatobacter sp.]